MRRQVRTFLIGLVALPLSIVPFALYASKTPEGRLLVDRTIAIVAPPELPEFSAEELDRIETAAPEYDEGVAVLVYHGIGSGSSGEGSFSVSPDRFAEHLATLEAAGMEPVTMTEVANALEPGVELPPNAVAVTFDDGRNDAMMFADPLLEQAGWKASMYVISGRAAGEVSPYYASWDDLVGYHRSGRWDLQAHTHELHRAVQTPDGELPALTALLDGESLAEYRARVRADLEANVAEIAERTGQRPQTFAYPFGAYGAERANDDRLQEVLAEEVGRLFDIAVDQDHQDRMTLADECSELLHVHRLDIHDWSGVDLLERIRAGADASRVSCGDRPGADA